MYRPHEMLAVRVMAGALAAYACAPLILGPGRAALLLGPLAPEYIREQVPLLATFQIWNWTHRLGCAALLLVGASQLRRFRRWHRAAGRLYVVLAAGVAVGGAWMAITSPFAAGETLPALFFAALLLGSVALGVGAARAGLIGTHRTWMERSYAVVLGPLLVRAVHLVLTTAGTGEREAMAPAFWLGWGAPLLALAIVRGRRS